MEALREIRQAGWRKVRLGVLWLHSIGGGSRPKAAMPEQTPSSCVATPSPALLLVNQARTVSGPLSALPTAA